MKNLSIVLALLSITAVAGTRAFRANMAAPAQKRILGKETKKEDGEPCVTASGQNGEWSNGKTITYPDGTVNVIPSGCITVMRKNADTKN